MRNTVSMISLAALAFATPALAQTAPRGTTPPQQDSTTAPAPSGQTSQPAPQTGQQGAPQTTTAPATTGGTAAPQTNPATGNPSVGGVAMDATKTIATNAAAAPNLSTLVSAVQAAGLAETLNGPGPFTVFAPTNDAFGRLAPGTVDTLLKPENKPSLAKVLTYHVVPGTITAEQLIEQAKATGGKTTLNTVAGQPLTVEVTGNAIKLTDVSGNASYVEIANVRQSNGVVHVVNGVLVPKL